MLHKNEKHGAITGLNAKLRMGLDRDTPKPTKGPFGPNDLNPRNPLRGGRGVEWHPACVGPLCILDRQSHED